MSAPARPAAARRRYDVEDLRRISGRITLYLLVFTLAVTVGFPLFWMLSASFKLPADLYVTPPTLLPTTWTLRNYTDLFEQTRFGTYFLNSLIVACGATGLSLLVGGLGAYSLSRFRYRSIRAFSSVNHSSYLLPEVLLVIPLYIYVIALGLADTLLSLVISNMAFTLPLTLWYMRAYFNAIPVSLEEAAMVEGCTRLQALRRVVLPLALPGLVATGVFSFNQAWNDFLFALVFTSSERNKVLPLGLATWIANDNVYMWGMLLAGAVLVTVPVLIVFFFAQGKLISGLAEGSNKGE
jgi:ABC-type glycerol-3-phosphate transport system permease component